MSMIRAQRWLVLALLLIVCQWMFGLADIVRSWAGLGGQAPQQVLQTQLSRFDTTTTWTKRIVAVGDLHSDFAHAARVLRTAKLIDHRNMWIGGAATLVQTGDIVDRGTDTIPLYRLLDTLRAQAALAGGEVVSLLGNHEFMNVMGDWRYVTPDDIATFHGKAARQRAFSSGWIGQTFLANYSVAARIQYTPPDLSQHLKDSTAKSALVAVHGGIHPDWANIESINTIGHKFLQRLTDAGATQLPRDTPPDERRFYSETGPVWYRGYALDSEKDGICEQADRVLAAVNASRMIMGHTPNFKGVVSRCQSKVIIIDTGISKAYGGVLSSLEILYSLKPQSHGGKGDDSIMIETEIVSAVYEHGREELSRIERPVRTAAVK